MADIIAIVECRVSLSDVVAVRNALFPAAGVASAPPTPADDETAITEHAEEDEEEEDYDLGDTAEDAAMVGYRIYTETTMRRLRDQMVCTLAEIAAISTTRARALLRAKSWSLDAALAQIAAVAESEPIVAEEDLATSSLSEATTSSETDSAAAAATVECPSCLDDIRTSDMKALSCGHAFCAGCWAMHIRTKCSEGRANRICCMGMAGAGRPCTVPVDQEFVEAVVRDDAKTLQLFEKASLEVFVEESGAHARWCSAPGCGRAIVVDVNPSIRTSEVTCECGHSMCFRCGNEAHFPASCEMVEHWRKLQAKEAADALWVDLNSKRCPHCGVLAVKESGCDFIVCRCGGYFCWKCGGPCYSTSHTMTTIEGHSCDTWLQAKAEQHQQAVQH
jgi:ariadne-1